MKIALILLCVMLNLTTYAGNFEKGVALARAGKHAEAGQQFTAYVRQHPKDSHAWYNLGVSAREQKHYLKALICFEKALKFKPHFEAAKSGIAYCRQQFELPLAVEEPFTVMQSNIIRVGQQNWRMGLLLFSILTGAAMFMAISNAAKRKYALIIGAAGLVFFLFCGFAARKEEQLRNGITHGIIRQPIEAVFSTEQGNALVKYDLKQGMRVEVLSVNGRVGISGVAGQIVYLNRSDISLY